MLNLTVCARSSYGNKHMHVLFSRRVGKKKGYCTTFVKKSIPFHTVHADHLGPLEKTSKGFRHLLVIIDAFTKFIRLYACKTTTSSESIKCFKDYFRSYSKPQRVVTDRGTAFTSAEFRNFMKSEKIVHYLHPSQLGLHNYTHACM